jgi:hypothetical protein
MKRLQGAVLAAAWIAAVGAAGCARDSITVRTEHQAAAAYVQPAAAPAQPPMVVEKSTVATSTVDHEHEPRGVLSTTVHFIGEVIALPFRLVGALIRAIF